MRLLVSVRSVDEARLAAAAGADFIDLKEPSAGALGALPLATVRAVVGVARSARRSATSRPMRWRRCWSASRRPRPAAWTT